MPIRFWGPEHHDSPRVEQFQQLLGKAMSRDYDGFSFDYDNQFRSLAVYAEYYERPQDKPLAVGRYLYRRHGAAARRLPVEMGVELGGGRVRVAGDGRRIVEASGIYYYNQIHVLILLHGMARYFIRNDLVHVYALHDINDEESSALYCDLLGLDPFRNKKIVFPGFTDKETRQEVVWGVLRGNRQAILRTEGVLEYMLRREGVAPAQIVNVIDG